MLGYTPLGHMLGENDKDKIKTKYAIGVDDIKEGAKTGLMYIIVFAVVAFLISFFSNSKCKMIPRIVKSIIAALLGLIYIIIFLIKYSLTDC